MARKYARIFVRGHYLFREASYEEQIMSKDKYPSIFSPKMEAIVFIILQIFFATHAVLKIGEYLTIVLRNRAEYRLILSRRGHRKIRRYSARLSRIIVLLFNKLITKLVTFLNLSVDIFSLHFFFPRTKLRISPNICYQRMTDIESMIIFG